MVVNYNINDDSFKNLIFPVCGGRAFDHRAECLLVREFFPPPSFLDLSPKSYRCFPVPASGLEPRWNFLGVWRGLVRSIIGMREADAK